MKPDVNWCQNNLFKTDKRQLFRELNRHEKTTPGVPDAQESRKFWSDLWNQPVQHNKDAEWLKEQRKQAENVPRQHDICVTKEGVEQQSKGMANWKVQEPEEVHAYCTKNFITALHNRIAEHLQSWLTTGNVPDWMVLGRTNLVMKDETKACTRSRKFQIDSMLTDDLQAAHRPASQNSTTKTPCY